MPRPLRTLTAAVLLLAPLGACQDAAGPGGPVIVISATWRNADDDDHTIFFRSSDDGQRSGVVAGREDGHPQFGSGSPVGGQWSDGRLELMIYRGEDARHHYVARFSYDNPDRLELTSTNGGPPFVLLAGAPP